MILNIVTAICVDLDSKGKYEDVRVIGQYQTKEEAKQACEKWFNNYRLEFNYEILNRSFDGFSIISPDSRVKIFKIEN